MPRLRYIRTFFRILENLDDILALRAVIFENRVYLLENLRHLLENEQYIRTYFILLELPAWILEL